MQMRVDDDIDLFRPHANGGELGDDRLLLALLRFFERQIALHPLLFEAGVEQHLLVAGIDIDREHREAVFDPLSVIPGDERHVEHERAHVEQIDAC